jgi:lipoprotein-anchoring transpeptidase ErfK/SrfK
VTVLRWRTVVPAAVAVLALVAGVVFWLRRPADSGAQAHSSIVWVSPSIAPTPAAIPVPAAPAGLPVLDYFRRPPGGFPADAQTTSAVPFTTALHPTSNLAVYNAPGGRPLAYAAPTISGVPTVMPIVGDRGGWQAVLVPSVNRRIGWVPPTGWVPARLRDQLVVHLRTHQLVWLRDGQVRHMWTVALGSRRTPTPRGRTYVMARSPSHGRVYAGVDILALGSVPENPGAVAAGLTDAHTGIHAWYDPSVFGKNVSNGCIRVPKAAQQQLVGVAPGTEVLVVD